MFRLVLLSQNNLNNLFRLFVLSWNFARICTEIVMRVSLLQGYEAIADL